MSEVPSNIIAMVGDPAMIRVAELRAMSQLRPKYEMEPTRRHRWSSASDDATTSAAFRSLMPSIIDEAMRIVVWIDPPIGILQKAAKVCEGTEQHFLIIGYESDTWDKRSKVLKQLEEAGQLHAFGYIRSFDHARFRSAIETIAKSEGLNLSSNCIAELERLGHLHRRSVATKSGRKSERLVHDLSRVRQEAIKAQLHAGWDAAVDIRDIQVVCRPSHHTEPWDAIDAMFGGNVAAAVKALDGCVEDMGEARQFLGLVRSQAEMLLNVRAVVEGSSLREPSDIATGIRSGQVSDAYDLWDSTKDAQAVVPPDEYRVKKLLELRGRPAWKNAERIIGICISAHSDLVRTLSGQWDVVLLRTVLDVAGVCSG